MTVQGLQYIFSTSRLVLKLQTALSIILLQCCGTAYHSNLRYVTSWSTSNSPVSDLSTPPLFLTMLKTHLVCCLKERQTFKTKQNMSAPKHKKVRPVRLPPEQFCSQHPHCVAMLHSNTQPLYQEPWLSCRSCDLVFEVT